MANIDGDILIALLGDIASKLEKNNDLLEELLSQIENVASDVSSIESDTDDIYYIKGKIDDVISEIRRLK